MSDLELKNQELEKFQYVLKYKIDELQRLIQPREQEIERMRNQLVEVNRRVRASRHVVVRTKSLLDSYGSTPRNSLHE